MIDRSRELLRHPYPWSHPSRLYPETFRQAPWKTVGRKNEPLVNAFSMERQPCCGSIGNNRLGNSWHIDYVLLFLAIDKTASFDDRCSWVCACNERRFESCFGLFGG
ncbi:odd-skipped family member drumstick isoform X1 [Halictus rubicundus]|uniref:odd-skipped family member drumstick isoform X1 n=1 Tax=Halictus rubicundus TaxID=77578 RepID=UPI004036E7E6